jgi:hypothetical protein
MSENQKVAFSFLPHKKTVKRITLIHFLKIQEISAVKPGHLTTHTGSSFVV